MRGSSGRLDPGSQMISEGLGLCCLALLSCFGFILGEAISAWWPIAPGFKTSYQVINFRGREGFLPLPNDISGCP